VEDGGGAIRIQLKIPGQSYRDQMVFPKDDGWTDARLKANIYLLRAKLEETGFVLARWQFPEAKP
jgi:hypothetical protein